MNHAIIRIDKYEIPLIGVPPEQTLEECHCCHDIFHIQDMELDETGKFFYCRKCK